MLESLLFIFLILVGGIFFIISLVVLIIGIINKSSKLKRIAFGIGIVPMICFCLIMFWYLIAVPSIKTNQMDDFSGTYKSFITENKLILLSDGTYEFEGDKSIRLTKNGIWKTGGIDGHFEFYDNNENLIEFASPYRSDGNKKIIFNLYDSDEVEFVKIKKQ